MRLGFQRGYSFYPHEQRMDNLQHMYGGRGKLIADRMVATAAFSGK